MQTIVNSRWQKFIRDSLPSLARKKWRQNQRNVAVGDIIMMAEDSGKIRGKWIIGRIVETYSGKGERVRNVLVRVKMKKYKRGLNSIAVIQPVESN